MDALKPFIELVSRWRLEASVADMTGDESRSALFSRCASELDTLVAVQLAARIEGRRAPAVEAKDAKPRPNVRDLVNRYYTQMRVSDCNAVRAKLGLPAPAPGLADKDIRAADLTNAKEAGKLLDLYREIDALYPAAPPTKDAGEWVTVPRDDDARSFSDSILPPAMIDAGVEVLDQVHLDLAGHNGKDVPDWDDGMVAVAVYRAMLATSPSPASEDAHPTPPAVERLVEAAWALLAVCHSDFGVPDEDDGDDEPVGTGMAVKFGHMRRLAEALATFQEVGR
ncbi:hypothetical protein [Caulobacter phage KcrB]|nr:hypothetical protein RW_GP032 [Caulobacter phage RW]WCA46336.1 hypothetical protein [Caulobacter phage KcrB]WCD56271.1 hypothetical protein [Caulobacter phage RLK]WNV48063.1 hypothetical protein GB2A_gp031 [Caulobacter phage GB2A]